MVLTTYCFYSKTGHGPRERNNVAWVSAQTIAEETGWDRATVTRCLKILLDEKLIIRDVRNRNRYTAKETHMRFEEMALRRIVTTAEAERAEFVAAHPEIEYAQTEEERARDKEVLDTLPDDPPAHTAPREPPKPGRVPISDIDKEYRTVAVNNLLVSFPGHRSLLDPRYTNSNLAQSADLAGGWQRLSILTYLMHTRKTEVEAKFFAFKPGEIKSVPNYLRGFIEKHIASYEEEIAVLEAEEASPVEDIEAAQEAEPTTAEPELTFEDEIERARMADERRKDPKW